jgi:hypothetical protein
MSTQRFEIAFVSPLKLMEVTEEGYAKLTITFENFTITAKGDVMYTLPVDNLVNMQVGYVDSAGNPAKVDGDVEWASSDEALVTVEVDAQDSTIVRVIPAGKLGQVQVTATADADLGDGVRQLITTCDIDVVAGEAVAGTVSPIGEPQPIAPHVEPQKRK